MLRRIIHDSLVSLGNAEIAAHSRRFFKTGRGEYGEGDRFLGIRVPLIRRQVRKYRNITLDDTLFFVRSPFHEERLFGILVLVERFLRGDAAAKTAVYEIYRDNMRYVNNWDLVDSSASHIVGAYLEHRDRKPLYLLAGSGNLWERRISIISTLHMIRNNDFNDTLRLSVMLISDTEDLIHKAVGWMLREIGKRDLYAETTFLKSFYRQMPRTMLRYAIERFPEQDRRFYLEK